MACGIPVVASPIGVNREIVQAGVNGELAANNEDWFMALSRLSTDAELRRSMGAQGRKRVEAWYSLQAQAPRVVGLLRDAIRRRRV
jgi:glycosyltransferase involved in cell wall biosynthesis